MSNIDSTQWNTRERATSSDLNRATKLLHRALAEGMAHLVSGATKRSGCFPDSFIATPQVGTMKTAIGPGLALWVDAAQVYPESTAVWVESRELREVTHDPADPQARYDVIEMRPGQAVSSTQPRDVFDPVTGAFTVQNLTKEVKCYPEFRIVKGTPAVTPSIPGGSSGWMPLAYVLVPAAVVTLDPQDVVYCRPILAAGSPSVSYAFPAQDAGPTNVKGGGLNAPGGGTVATLAAPLTGSFYDRQHKFNIAQTASFNLSPLTHDGGGLPGVPSTVYLYAVPPPYPSGYDASLAGREIWSPKQIYGTSGGFQNPTRQSGCIVISSTTKIPNSYDPAGASAGVASINHPFFSALASAIDMTNAVYIGSVFYDQLTLQYVLQRSQGAIIGANRKTGAQFDGDLPIAAPTLYSLASNWVADPVFALPSHVRRVKMFARCQLSPGSWLYLQFADQNASATGYPRMILSTTLNAAAPDNKVEYDSWVTLNDLQQMQILQGAGGLFGTCVLHAYEWEDPVLARR